MTFKDLFRNKGFKRTETGGIPLLHQLADVDPFFVEQFKSLRAKFEYQADIRNNKVVAITSAIAGEGKTVLSANLASNLASTGRRKVLIIDADIRKSDLGRAFGVNSKAGLSEYLSGVVDEKDIIQSWMVPGLYIIPAGKMVREPADLIAGEIFRTLLRTAREQFDVVLLDTPPVLPVADTLSLKDQVDGFIVVCRAGFTPYPMIRQAVEEIGEKNIIGVVLNGVEPRKQKYYQRYYGKYYTKPTSA